MIGFEVGQGRTNFKRVGQFFFLLHSVLDPQHKKRLHLGNGVFNDDALPRQRPVFFLLFGRQRLVPGRFAGDKNVPADEVLSNAQKPQVYVYLSVAEVKTGQCFLENGEVVYPAVVRRAHEQNAFERIADEQPF